MQTLQATSDDGKSRHLDVERRESEIYLYARTPENTGSGQEILVSHADLVSALQSGHGTLSGVSPVQRKPKECIVENRPEGLRLQIHPISQVGSWWVVLKYGQLEAAIA